MFILMHGDSSCLEIRCCSSSSTWPMTSLQSSGAVWKSRWLSWSPVPNKPTVSVDVKQHFIANFIIYCLPVWFEQNHLLTELIINYSAASYFFIVNVRGKTTVFEQHFLGVLSFRDTWGWIGGGFAWGEGCHWCCTCCYGLYRPHTDCSGVRWMVFTLTTKWLTGHSDSS